MAFCFHTYVRTPDVSSVRISGLKGVDFIDKTVEGHPVKTEAREDIAVGEFTDRVYKSAPSHVAVSDSEKTLVFEKTSGIITTSAHEILAYFYSKILWTKIG